MTTTRLALSGILRLTDCRILAREERTIGRRHTLRIVRLVLRRTDRMTTRPLVVLLGLLVRVLRVSTNEAGRLLVSTEGERASLVEEVLLDVLVVLRSVEVSRNVARSLVLERVVTRRVRVSSGRASDRTGLEHDRASTVTQVRDLMRVVSWFLRLEVVENSVFDRFSRCELAVGVG